MEQAANPAKLRRKLNRSLRMQKLRALVLVAPLLIFILVTFLSPIADMLFRSVENGIVSETLPRTVASLKALDYRSGIQSRKLRTARFTPISQ